MKRTVRSSDLGAFAGDILKELKGKERTHALVVGLKGELGAGKTTFTQHIAKELGVEETVASPTFVIEKIYKLPEGVPFEHLIHIDAYRLSNSVELRALGWQEAFENPDNLIVVEWPERITDILPADIHTIEFSPVDGDTDEREVIWQ